MEVDFYILAPPLMPSNHLSEPVKGECSYPPPASSPCFPPVVSRKATEKDGCCLIPSLSSLSLFQLENRGRSLQPPRQTTTKTCVSCLLFIYPLVCWLNHFTPAINKKDKWMDVNSLRLLIYKQTRRLFFKRKLYGTFQFCWFSFCFLNSPTLTPSWILCKKEENNSLRHNTTDTHTGAINTGVWKTHTHLHSLCYYISEDLYLIL